MRFRECISEDKDNCIGPNNEQKNCNTHQCPTWMEWTVIILNLNNLKNFFYYFIIN